MATPEQIEEAIQELRAARVALFNVSQERGAACARRKPCPSAIQDLNALIAAARVNVRTARLALAALLDE